MRAFQMLSMRWLRGNYYMVFLSRIVLLYLVFGLCRVFFVLWNGDIVGLLPWNETGPVLKGSFIFDSASIFYINIPFILCSLLPFRFRERPGYQTFLLWLFVVINGLGLIINIADIFYFPFKLSRIASDDLHFLTEGNFWALAGSFLIDYWPGVLLWTACVLLLWAGFRFLRYKPERNRVRLVPAAFFIAQLLLIGGVGTYMIFAIRGFSFSPASYPITMSDASLYVKPQYAPLILSNPFCLIRTMGHKSESYTEYFPSKELDEIYPVIHRPLDSVNVSITDRPNIMLIVLESFGAAHLKSFSDQFGANDVSYTPFLDSLAVQSYIFTNAFQNGLRSIDAMPAIWASIPSFKTQFLSLPASVAEYKAMPSCLADMGYSTVFMHGAVRKSMSFVSFGQMAGVERFYSREDYEAEHGTGDSDGKWGIWDHKFLPFAESRLNEMRQPFFATLFTLSSHHPFLLPQEFEEKFPEGTLEIHKMIAYSDHALREFFTAASGESWFDNTLFVLTADHGSGGDSEKYRQMPYAYAVPIIFYYPGKNLAGTQFPDGKLAGRHERTSQHIDLMPTLLRMVGYREPVFAFGRDAFNDPDAGFAINYYGSAFNYMTDSTRYVFNEQNVTEVSRYRKDPAATELKPSDSVNISRMKAFIQQYYTHLKDKNYKP